MSLQIADVRDDLWTCPDCESCDVTVDRHTGFNHVCRTCRNIFSTEEMLDATREAMRPRQHDATKAELR